MVTTLTARVIQSVIDNPGQTARWYAEHLDALPSSVSSILNRLAGREILNRTGMELSGVDPFLWPWAYYHKDYIRE